MGGVIRLRKVDQPESFAAALDVPIRVAATKEFDRTTYRMWQICLLAGMVAVIFILAGGWAVLGPVYDSIMGIDGYSIRARNLLLMACVLGMIAASGLAFYACRILPLVAARRSLSARQMQQVIYGEALEAINDGEFQLGTNPVKARIFHMSVPVGVLSSLCGLPLRLDAAGLRALYESLPPAATRGGPAAEPG